MGPLLARQCSSYGRYCFARLRYPGNEHFDSDFDFEEAEASFKEATCVNITLDSISSGSLIFDDNSAELSNDLSSPVNSRNETIQIEIVNDFYSTPKVPSCSAKNLTKEKKKKKTKHISQKPAKIAAIKSKKREGKNNKSKKNKTHPLTYYNLKEVVKVIGDSQARHFSSLLQGNPKTVTVPGLKLGDVTKHVSHGFKYYIVCVGGNDIFGKRNRRDFANTPALSKITEKVLVDNLVSDFQNSLDKISDFIKEKGIKVAVAHPPYRNLPDSAELAALPEIHKLITKFNRLQGIRCLIRLDHKTSRKSDHIEPTGASSELSSTYTVRRSSLSSDGVHITSKCATKFAAEINRHLQWTPEHHLL